MEQMIYDKVVGPVLKLATDLIIKHVGYATCSTKHVNNMRNKLKVLEDTSADVQNHMGTNMINNREVPTGVPDWLNDVETLEKRVESFSSEGINGCLNMKMRYRAGRNAFKATEAIEELLTKNSEFTWTDAPNATGRVDSKPAPSTTCTPSSSSTGGDGFKSRDKPYNDALKFLQQDDARSQVIALCGMGGVGKTTMMEQLKTVASDKNMFNWIVKVVLGRNPNMLSVQHDIGVQLGGEGLREATITTRADSLCSRFRKILEDDKKKILVILDDVWGKIELKDFGLTSPIPSGVKLLLTSRDSNTCTQIAADVVSMIQIVRVDVLEEAEAQAFFSQITGVSEEDDHDKYQIGCGIVKKCGLLPLAIELIAKTLKSQEDYVWRDTHRQLMNNDFDDDVQEIIRISYEYMKKDKECEEIFLHCGLFPEDYNIRIEDLTRHAWGLKLLKNVSTLSEARDRTNTYVRKLINANLLMESDFPFGCVKMHDLVLAFVLVRVSKGDYAWTINHGDVSKWCIDETSKRISLTCMGMYEFPRAFMYPNLSMLQLMRSDTLLKFPEDFYKNLENLNVIAYNGLSYPLLPRSLENLTTLCLYNCKLTSTLWSSVGDLVNLEVLSFSDCGIRKLPSTIGNLRKLKVLDLTGSVDLHIDDGVFKNLENLEELYMRASYRTAIVFTQTNIEEVKMLSSRLCALEIEFVKVDLAQLKDMCFKKLDKFNISMGCKLNIKFAINQNSLEFVTDSCSFLANCNISELFKKTEILYLQVKDMTGLEDIGPVYSYGQRSFCNLKEFRVYECDKLKHLFPIHVARGLGKLETFRISSCSVLETVVHNDGREIDSCVQEELIKFEELKYLSLIGLPKLVSLFPVENVVELPQLVELRLEGLPNLTSIYPDKNHTCALFNSHVRFPQLKELYIISMEKLKQIWSSSGEEKVVNNISMLTRIRVYNCNRLLILFPTNPMRLLTHLEKVGVYDCGSIEVIFNIDMECVGDELEQVSSSGLRSVKVSDSWNMLQGVTSTNNHPPPLLPNLQSLKLTEISSMSHVWKCNNWSKFLLQNQSSFHNLTSIRLDKCQRIKYLFSPLMGKLLSNLQEIYITNCDGVEEVVSNRDDDGDDGDDDDDDDDDDDGNEESTTYATTALFPRLCSLYLHELENLKHIGGGDQFKFASWSLCQYFQIIHISDCNGLSSVIPSYAVGQMQKLEELIIMRNKSLTEVFQTHGINDNNNDGSSTNIDEGDGSMDSTSTTMTLSKLRKIYVPQLSNLKKLTITNCDLLRHVFTFCTLESLMKLEMLKVQECKEMEVIVKEQKREQTTTSKFVVFPRLKSLELCSLPHLKGFFLGMNDFQWPLLDKVLISECPQMMVFTARQSTARELKYIHTNLGKHRLECGLNFHVATNLHKTCLQHSQSTSLERLPWSFYNLIDMDIKGDKRTGCIIPYNQLLQLQKLEKIQLYNCPNVEELFEVEAMVGTKQTHIVEIPNLTQLELTNLFNLKYIWKSNHDGVKVSLLFPNLTTISLNGCEGLKHAFTSSMVSSLIQLQYLHISYCQSMEIIVNEEEEEENEEEEKQEDEEDEEKEKNESKSTPKRDAKEPKDIVALSCLKSVKVENLYSLKGFCLGKDNFSCPSLHILEIKNCPQITTFTKGHFATPALKLIDTSFGKCYLREDLNSFMKTKQHEGFQF